MTKSLFICLMVGTLSMLSCSIKTLDEPPLHYSYLPPKLDFDSIKSYIKVTPEPAITFPEYPDREQFRDFEMIPVSLRDLALNDSVKYKIGNGILFSPLKGRLYSYYKEYASAADTYKNYYKVSSEANLARFHNAKYLYDTYYEQSKAAEVLYQNEILHLRKDVRRSWLEKNMVYIGFSLGILVTLMTEWAVLQVAE